MDSKYAEQTMESMSAPGLYFGFGKYDSATYRVEINLVDPNDVNLTTNGVTH